MKALTFHHFGGPEVLQYEEVPEPSLRTGDLLVEMKAIGLNYADIYRRKGNYYLKGKPPYIAGYEGAGIVIDTNGNSGIRVGDRVGFADVPFANAERVAVPIRHTIPLPDDLSIEVAASSLLQGLTAHYLSTDSHRVAAGETVVIHAAAGGVGGLLTQLCKYHGAIVIGLTTSEKKYRSSCETGRTRRLAYAQIGKQPSFNLPMVAVPTWFTIVWVEPYKRV